MTVIKTPGVYIVEKNAFPNSVVEVATTVPAFIGYTEFAKNGTKDMTGKPWRVTSMAEFHIYFGGAPIPKFSILTDTIHKYAGIKYTAKHTLYYQLLLFFSNGGGACYIVSVGSYNDDLDSKQFIKGIETLLKEQEPAMLVVPEAVNLGDAACKDVQQAMLKHCGHDTLSRFAILDIWNGNKDRRDPDAGDVITKFRESIGNNYLNFGAAYYPWLNTCILQDSDIGLANFDETSLQSLENILINQLNNELSLKADEKEELKNKYAELNTEECDKTELHKTLYAISAIYRNIIKDALFQLNCLPVSAAMAGVYTRVDNTQGVWRAPANVGIANVVRPAVNLTSADQEDLNVPVDGKAINAIRPFVGEGIKVWGARTLDGNSLDWRYINVRRTMIMLEESIKNATRAYVFDPNVANTWVYTKSMISNFLNGIWKRGGLAGSSPEDAYSVHVGLGETMTPEDILEGIMRVTVLVALVRPAEFIRITFQQQMQK